MFTELLKSEYQIQQLQQTCRGDILRKRPHDDHQDNDQPDGEKAKCLCTKGDFSSMPAGNTNTEEVNVKQSGDTKIVKDDMKIRLKLTSDVAIQILESKRLSMIRKLLKSRQQQEMRGNRRKKLKLTQSPSKNLSWKKQNTVITSSRKIIPEHKFEALYGITQWPKVIQTMYKLRTGQPQPKKYVYSKNKIMNILNTEMEKRWGQKYVLLFVKSASNLRYRITKADFCMLELDDIEFLCLEQIEETKWKVALKDFMK
ncbi:hypothetical protein Tco_0981089 [Tanacetum coccineum]